MLAANRARTWWTRFAPCENRLDHLDMHTGRQPVPPRQGANVDPFCLAWLYASSTTQHSSTGSGLDQQPGPSTTILSMIPLLRVSLTTPPRFSAFCFSRAPTRGAPENLGFNLEGSASSLSGRELARHGGSLFHSPLYTGSRQSIDCSSFPCFLFFFFFSSRFRGHHPAAHTNTGTWTD